MNDNVGNMPLEVYCDYISELLNQEWQCYYFYLSFNHYHYTGLTGNEDEMLIKGNSKYTILHINDHGCGDGEFHNGQNGYGSSLLYVCQIYGRDIYYQGNCVHKDHIGNGGEGQF